MDRENRPSRRLKLLPWAAVWLVASAVLHLVAYDTLSDELLPGETNRWSGFFAVLGDLCRWIGVVLLLGYIVARVLEELHGWRMGQSEQPPDRDWFAG